jgi:integrase
MTKIRLPFIHEYTDRHGKLRRYVRRPGFKQIRLNGIPGSPEFMATYENAIAGQAERKSIGAGRTRPGTVNAAIVGYYNSVAFRTLAPNTQGLRRRILERFRVEHGEKRIALLPREVIVRLLGRMPRFAAQNWLKAIRGLLEFAVAEGFRADNPAQGIKLPTPKSDGFHTWTEEEIEQFDRHHPQGSRARLALAILLYTAQRRADVVRMGRQHVRQGILSVRQNKTGAALEIPIHRKLKRVLDSVPGDNLTFLVTAQGQPFTPQGFGNWFSEQCKAAGLPAHCAAHGLRKAACRRLAEAGCSVHQIAAISGHRSLKEIERNTRAVDQARLDREAIRLEQRRTAGG